MLAAPVRESSALSSEVHSSTEALSEGGRGTLEGLEELIPEPDLLLGALVAERYQVTELIGRGGMGAVYRAEHVHMRKTVALKVLHREMTAHDEVVARFEREAIAAGRVEHPNVVRALDFGRLPDGSFYLVLDYVEGRPLDRVLRAAGEVFSVERVLNISGQIAEALEAAHAQGIVHRDLKPDNVMLVARGDEPEMVKVLDFGIAKISIHERGQKDQPITQAGTVFGTPEYMSPEQAAGQAVDQRGDLYALGLLMYRMLAGHPPFSGAEVQAVLMMQITQPPPALERAIPAELSELVFKLLEKNAEDRVRTASEVVARILAMLDNELTPSQSKVRAKISSITQMDLPRPSLSQRLDASWMGRPLVVVGLKLAAWRVLVVATGALGLGAGLVLGWFGATTTPPPPLQAEREAVTDPVEMLPPSLPEEPVDPELERLLGRVFLGDEQAVAELERREPEARTAREWIALARGRVKNQRVKEGLEAYEAALKLQPSVSEDAVVRRDVWSAASSSGVDTAQLAARLAAEHLGSAGADMLYKIWVDTREVTPATQLARELVYRAEVRAKASPALEFLLAWREAIDCSDYAKLLPKATLHADRRALTLLKRTLGKNDCKLPTDALEAAVLAARDRQQQTPY